MEGSNAGSKLPAMLRVGASLSKAMAGKKEKMSVKVILDQAGLSEYYPWLDRSGYRMLDAHFKPTDLLVEQILADVERQCGRRLPPDVRVRLWKALRYMSFRGPGREIPFIERGQVPRLFLPKRDYKHIDWMVKLSELDPDRQRQVVRETKRLPPTEFDGPGVETFQFEVYNRQKDLWYEFKDLQRSVDEWQRKDPRNMMREDPREEVIKIRLKQVVELCQAGLLARSHVNVRSRLVLNVLLIIRAMAAVLALLMFVSAYWRFKDTPAIIFVGFFAGSHQFLSGISFVVAFIISWAVSQRRRDDPMLIRLRRIIISCERLMEQITDFRGISEGQRLVAAEAPKPVDIQKPARQKKQRSSSEARELKRRQKKKKRMDKDPNIMMWAPELLKTRENIFTIRDSLADTYTNGGLDPLPEGFRRPGGDRMEKFKDRLGNRLAGVNEEKMSVGVVAGARNMLACDLPNLPCPPPRVPLQRALQMDLPALPPRPPDASLRVAGLPPGPTLRAAADTRLDIAPAAPPAATFDAWDSARQPSSPQAEVPGYVSSPRSHSSDTSTSTRRAVTPLSPHTPL